MFKNNPPENMNSRGLFFWFILYTEFPTNERDQWVSQRVHDQAEKDYNEILEYFLEVFKE